MEILSIIPARCGSKGIKDKNIVDLCGKPLIHYSIEIGKELVEKSIISESIVSTDCERIASISKELGANVPFLRPEYLSGDKAKSIDYVIHALDYFKEIDKIFDAVLILQPTSPLRTFENVKESIEIFNTNKFDSLISAYKDETINLNIIYTNNNGLGYPLDQSHNIGSRRQDHDDYFIRNGAIYITKCNLIYNQKVLVSNEPYLYEMKKSLSVNLDTEEDLELIRSMLCK